MLQILLDMFERYKPQLSPETEKIQKSLFMTTQCPKNWPKVKSRPCSTKRSIEGHRMTFLIFLLDFCILQIFIYNCYFYYILILPTIWWPEHVKQKVCSIFQKITKIRISLHTELDQFKGLTFAWEALQIPFFGNSKIHLTTLKKEMTSSMLKLR